MQIGPALRRQHAVGAVASIFEERAVHAERTALMIDEALRAEFGNRKKPGTLDVALVFAVRITLDVGHKRQAREIVSGKEPLSCEISIQIEVVVLSRCGLQ